jgi:parallel beta-helix repeat protein
VHDCPNAGIGGLWIDYMTVENNTVWNNARHSCENSSGIGFYQPHDSGIDFGATTVNGTDYRIIIANNRIYLNEAEINTCVPIQVNWPTDGNGIILDDFMSSQVGDEPDAWNHQWKNVLYPHRTLIMNNIVYGNGGRGILVSGSSHADVIHNTVYNNLQSQPLRDHCGMLGEIAGEGTDMRIFNNIAVAQHKYSLSLKLLSTNIPDRQNIVYGNNLTYGGLGFDNDPTYQSIVADAGSNIITQDPLLTAPSLDGSADFHLEKGSPAINKGSAANSVPTDFEGRTRPFGGLPDIGAYETNYAGGMCINPVIKLLLDGK